MRQQKDRDSRRRTTALLALIGLAVLVVGVLPAAGDHGLPHPQLLARGSFVDEVSAQIRVKPDEGGRQVINVKDASDLVILEIVIHAGAHAPWHTHSGPGLLVNMGPGTLTSFIGDDCVPVEYPPGTAFIDPGQGTPHAAVNNSEAEVVLFAVFLGVGNGPVIPTDPPADCPL
jgi:quercetin dioxygenase-like cupin family protein